MIRKALVATALMALASTPAWALPAGAPSNSGTAHAPETTPVGPPSSTPNDESNPGSSNRSEEGNANAGGGEHRIGASSRSEEGAKHKGGGSSNGKSHKCRPHSVAYIASGTLVSASLTEEEGGHHTYKGEVTIEVKRTNHHAHGDMGMTKTYMVEGAHVSGPVPVSALEKGDWVKVIGRITTLAKKCEAGEFKPAITVRRIVVHGPRTSTTTTTSTTSTLSSTTSSTETTSTSTSTSST